MALICKKALAAVGSSLPVERAKRVEMLNALESDELNELLEECDNMFYAYEDDLNTLNYEYIMNHKETFM